MSLPSETVTLAGSGLTFFNTYDATVSTAYRSAIIAAENFFQSHFTNTVRVGMTFGMQPLSGSALAQNEFSVFTTSYANLVAVLRSHATTSDDALAVNGLPSSDPSGGMGFGVPMSEARILGMTGASNATDDDIVVLNSNHAWTFGQDVVSVLEHEISEGVFGRVGSLGAADNFFEPMDLFRFTTSGVRDYTGGADGKTAVFGIDGAHLSNLVFHNSLSFGSYDGSDLADWQNTTTDAFGPALAGTPSAVSATDLVVLDILGWTPTGGAGGSAGGGDTIQGTSGPDTVTGGSLGPNYLRGNDGNDVINGGTLFDDINGNMGNDTLHGGAGDDWVVGGKDNDVQFGDAGDDVVWGNLGGDTLDGGDGNDQVRGGQGDDIVNGGAGNDYVSGDRGNDTITGGTGADLFHSFSGAGIDKVLDFHASEGDRVMLDPGTAYQVNQVGGDTIIDMANGDQMILVGVQMSTLPQGWIFQG